MSAILIRDHNGNTLYYVPSVELFDPDYEVIAVTHVQYNHDQDILVVQVTLDEVDTDEAMRAALADQANDDERLSFDG